MYDHLKTTSNKFFNELVEEVFGGILTYDLIDENNAYILETEMPGYKKEDVSITVHQGILVVSGESTRPKRNYIRTANTYGKTTRNYGLPKDADVDNISAKLEDGILKITIPKSTIKKSKIKID